MWPKLAAKPQRYVLEKHYNEESIQVLLVSEILQGPTRQRTFLQLAPIHI